MPVIHTSDYYNSLNRYFKDKMYDDKINDHNFSNGDTLEKCIENNIISDENLDFSSSISFITSTKNGIIKPTIDSIGLLGDPVLFDLIRCSEYKIKDSVITNMTLYDLRLIITLICSHLIDYNPELEKIVTYFPKTFFLDIYNTDFSNNDNRDKFISLKYPKFRPNLDLVFSNVRDDVLFLDDLALFNVTLIDSEKNKFFELTPKFYNMTIRLVMDINVFNRIQTMLYNTSAKFIFDYRVNDKIAVILVCDLTVLKKLCSMWACEINSSSPTISFLYYCLMVYNTIYEYIKLPKDEEENLINFLVNNNARNK